MSDNSLYPAAIRAAEMFFAAEQSWGVTELAKLIHDAIEDHLKGGGREEPSPRPARSAFAKGDMVTFRHKGEVKRGEVVEVDTDDPATARLTVWLNGIWVKIHPDHCVREE